MSKQEDFTTSGNLTEYEVHALFPVPIFTIDNLVDTDIPILRSIQEIPMDKGSYDYGFRSENTYILNNPALFDLKQAINSALQDYANNVLGFAGRFSITQSWVSLKQPGQRHTMHSHANSIISGVYYFSNDKDKNDVAPSGLTFVKSAVTSTGTFQMAPLVNPNVENQFTFNEITLSIENNMLCMFPSYLPHRVNDNASGNPRYSIAFNAMPTYALGSDGDLTECEFLRINTR